MAESTPKLVLVTGAAGRIGSYFSKNANQQKYKLRLMVYISFFLNSNLILFSFG
jgi:FlaA1/EpsC-like NDP-sugar epimerase